MRFTGFSSAVDTITSISRLRFRLVVFLVRMCRACEWPRLTLPPAVSLKRLAAPLCVFSFGIISPLLFDRFTSSNIIFMNSFFLRRQHNKHVHSFKLRPYFHYSCFREVLFEPLQQRETEFLVSNLAATKVNGRLHLVAIVKYANRIVLLEHVVVLIRARPELDLLNGNERLFCFSFL